MKMDKASTAILALIAVAMLFGFMGGQVLATDGWLDFTTWLISAVLFSMAVSWFRKRRAKKKQRQKEMEESLLKFVDATKTVLTELLTSPRKTKQSSETTGSTNAFDAMATGMRAVAQGVAAQPASSGDSAYESRLITVYRGGKPYSYNANNLDWYDDAFNPNCVWGPCCDYNCPERDKHQVTYHKEP